MRNKNQHSRLQFVVQYLKFKKQKKNYTFCCLFVFHVKWPSHEMTVALSSFRFETFGVEREEKCHPSQLSLFSCALEFWIFFFFADMDSYGRVGAQLHFLFWFCTAPQWLLCDLQPPCQPSGDWVTPNVPLSFLHHMCSHYCGSSVTQVRAHTHTHTAKTHVQVVYFLWGHFITH